MTESLDFVNEATPISDGVAHNKDLVFVNDWSELERSLEILADWKSFSWHDSLTEDMEQATTVILDYVPRLLTQYGKLLELSYVLTDLVEKQNELRPQTGLYLPDHS